MSVLHKPLFVATATGLVVGIAAALLALYWPAPGGPAATATISGKAAIGGPFSLVDPSGRRVTDRDLAGKPMLVYFGFTHCPDVCPAGLQVISAALDKLGPDAEKVTPVFITLDPERDTPKLLGEYVKSFHPRILALSGTVEEAAGAAKAYRVYSKKVATGTDPANYAIDHSAFMYLMDGQGNFVMHFPHSVAIDQLAASLKAAI